MNYETFEINEVVVEFEIGGIRISYVTDDITVTLIKDIFHNDQ
ncbi:hypothetical protein RJI07_09150 [Mycoplasmatota bacterium WC30]